MVTCVLPSSKATQVNNSETVKQRFENGLARWQKSGIYELMEYLQSTQTILKPGVTSVAS